MRLELAFFRFAIHLGSPLTNPDYIASSAYPDRETDRRLRLVFPNCCCLTCETCPGLSQEQLTAHGNYPITAERLFAMTQRSLLFQGTGPIIVDSEEFMSQHNLLERGTVSLINAPRYASDPANCGTGRGNIRFLVLRLVSDLESEHAPSSASSQSVLAPSSRSLVPSGAAPLSRSWAFCVLCALQFVCLSVARSPVQKYTT